MNLISHQDILQWPDSVLAEQLESMDTPELMMLLRSIAGSASRLATENQSLKTRIDAGINALSGVREPRESVDLPPFIEQRVYRRERLEKYAYHPGYQTGYQSIHNPLLPPVLEGDR